MKGHGPPDPKATTRVVGVATFLRLPYLSNTTDVDAAIVGLPFDGGSTYRTGARFGPRAIREGSLTLRSHYNPAQRVDVFERLSVVDAGDAAVVPGSTGRSLALMQEKLGAVHESGAVPLGLGGDHTVLLAELRAAAQRHGPLALVLFDAHDDAGDDDYGEKYGHGTPVRRALDEGLIDARRSTILGLRGGMDAADDHDRLRDAGFTIFTGEDLAQIGTAAVAAAVDRAAGGESVAVGGGGAGSRVEGGARGGKSFLSFDIDFVDPAFAPGTGTPECGGPTSAQALALVRACRGLELAGADVVEVVPDLDYAYLTATLAATVAWEILSLVACEPPTSTVTTTVDGSGDTVD